MTKGSHETDIEGGRDWDGAGGRHWELGAWLVSLGADLHVPLPVYLVPTAADAAWAANAIEFGASCTNSSCPDGHDLIGACCHRFLFG